MIFTKDDLAVTVRVSLKRRNWFSESARLPHLGHIARTFLWRKTWTVCKPQISV